MKWNKSLSRVVAGAIFCGLLSSAVPALAGVIDVEDDVTSDAGSSSRRSQKEEKKRKRPAPKVNVNFALETSDPIPFSLPVVNSSTEKLTWGQLNYGSVKFLDGANFHFGTQFIDGCTELALQLGFRMVKGDFLAGSKVNKDKWDLADYKAFYVPVRFYLRFAPFKWKVRPYAGLFAGVNIGSLSYSYTKTSIPATDVTIIQAAAGLRGGIDFQIVKGFGFGLYFEGELASKTEVSGAVPLSMTGMRAGLSLFYNFRVKQTAVQELNASDNRIPSSYNNMKEHEEQEAEAARQAAEKQKEAEETRMAKAFEEIKKGDEAKFNHRCDQAIGYYRQGLAYLPKSRDADKNIGVPVRLDWASCLVELDKINEAIKILKIANRLDPDNTQVINNLEALGGEAEATPTPAAPVYKAPSRGVPVEDDGLAPVEPLDGEL